MSCHTGRTVSRAMIGRHLGLSVGATYRNLDRGTKKAALIMEGDDAGYELIDEEKERSKYKPEDLDRFEEWIKNECEVVIDNPCKNDEVIERDRKSEYVLFVIMIHLSYL